MVHDRGNNLSVAVNAKNAKNNSAVQMPGDGHVPENYTAYEHLWMNSRTRNTGTARDNSYAIGARGVSTKYDNRLPVNHKYDNHNMTVDDQDDYSRIYSNTDRYDITVISLSAFIFCG